MREVHRTRTHARQNTHSITGGGDRTHGDLGIGPLNGRSSASDGACTLDTITYRRRQDK